MNRERLCDTLTRAGGTLDFSGFALPKAKPVPISPARRNALISDRHILEGRIADLRNQMNKPEADQEALWPKLKLALDNMAIIDRQLNQEPTEQ
jgi:hypothetical protein